jgi:hypothetical protein
MSNQRQKTRCPHKYTDQRGDSANWPTCKSGRCHQALISSSLLPICIRQNVLHPLQKREKVCLHPIQPLLLLKITDVKHTADSVYILRYKPRTSYCREFTLASSPFLVPDCNIRTQVVIDPVSICVVVFVDSFCRIGVLFVFCLDLSRWV